MSSITIRLAFFLCCGLVPGIVFSPAYADEDIAAFPAAKKASPEALDDARGMANPFNPGEVTNSSEVSGNSVIYNGDAEVTQTNTIDNAFNHSASISTVVQNAGNNVLIENATNIFITINSKPGGN
ncbi:hypothetical protein [Emcibacter sp.]|uniref:hypothetical protein n=1 Tax=Emcibacter sp. TaxID=1979954 RepID=UPI002AA6121B|nr:hypothetical protein [Emcibacter sp.]